MGADYKATFTNIQKELLFLSKGDVCVEFEEVKKTNFEDKE